MRGREDGGTEAGGDGRRRPAAAPTRARPDRAGGSDRLETPLPRADFRAPTAPVSELRLNFEEERP